MKNYFVSYSFKDKFGTGFGNVYCLGKGGIDLEQIEEWRNQIIEKNNSSSIIILNFIEIK